MKKQFLKLTGTLLLLCSSQISFGQQGVFRIHPTAPEHLAVSASICVMETSTGLPATLNSNNTIVTAVAVDSPLGTTQIDASRPGRVSLASDGSSITDFTILFTSGSPFNVVPGQLFPINVQSYLGNGCYLVLTQEPF